MIFHTLDALSAFVICDQDRNTLASGLNTKCQKCKRHGWYQAKLGRVSCRRMPLRGVCGVSFCQTEASDPLGCVPCHPGQWLVTRFQLHSITKGHARKRCRTLCFGRKREKKKSPAPPGAPGGRPGLPAELKTPAGPVRSTNQPQGSPPNCLQQWRVSTLEVAQACRAVS